MCVVKMKFSRSENGIKKVSYWKNKKNVEAGMEFSCVMPAAVWKNLQCLQSIDGEIVLAFSNAFRSFRARFALHMPGKNYIMEKWTKKSESTNT